MQTNCRPANWRASNPFAPRSFRRRVAAAGCAPKGPSCVRRGRRSSNQANERARLHSLSPARSRLIYEAAPWSARLCLPLLSRLLANLRRNQVPLGRRLVDMAHATSSAPSLIIVVILTLFAIRRRLPIRSQIVGVASRAAEQQLNSTQLWRAPPFDWPAVEPARHSFRAPLSCHLMCPFAGRAHFLSAETKGAKVFAFD